MTTQHGGHRVIVAAVALALVCSWITPALAQAPPGDFASVVSAARAWPGCLGVETGQTSSGKRVIFGSAPEGDEDRVPEPGFRPRASS